MSNLVAEYKISEYEELTALNDSQKVHLVKSTVTGKIAVKKEVLLEQGEIYQLLQQETSKYIPEIYDVILYKNKSIIIEEFIQGETLEQKLTSEGVLNFKMLTPIIASMCDCLDFLHNKGIIHRDLTLTNIIIDKNGVLKLIDFGISRIEKDNQSQDTTILGTQGFAAPEQFGFKQTDKRCDIYALGVVMNMMLTGEFPSKKLYDGKNSNIIKKCIQIDPSMRFDNVKQIKYIFSQLANEDANTLSKVLRAIPGFRTMKWWKMILAFYGYICLLAPLRSAIGYLENGDIKNAIINALAYYFILLYPVAIIINFAGAATNLPFVKYRFGWKRIALLIVWIFVSFTIGCIILQI